MGGDVDHELLLLDGSNYPSWCSSISMRLEAINPVLLSVFDASIVSSTFDEATKYTKEEETWFQRNAQAVCVILSGLSRELDLMLYENFGSLEDAHELWMIIKEIIEAKALHEDPSIEGDAENPSCSEILKDQAQDESANNEDDVALSASLGKPEVPVLAETLKCHLVLNKRPTAGMLLL
jgi:hypothetical protein